MNLITKDLVNLYPKEVCSGTATSITACITAGTTSSGADGPAAESRCSVCNSHRPQHRLLLAPFYCPRLLLVCLCSIHLLQVSDASIHVIELMDHLLSTYDSAISQYTTGTAGQGRG